MVTLGFTGCGSGTGWNLHEPEDVGIDSFQADRAPDGQYKTMNLAR